VDFLGGTVTNIINTHRDSMVDHLTHVVLIFNPSLWSLFFYSSSFSYNPFISSSIDGCKYSPFGCENNFVEVRNARIALA